MNNDKYGRNVNLICPTCGGDQFEYGEVEVALVTCASCEREMTKEQLIDENSENVQANVSEVTQEIKKDFEKKIKDIFKNNNNFRLK
ncbi:MAG: hypothetical protein R6W74_10745 [Nitrosomonas halophila]